MKIYTSGLKPHHRLDYPGIVRDLLRRLPPEHLAGIAYITVSGDRPLDDDSDVLGQYYERFEGEPAVIVLYLETMRREMPRLVRPFAISWRIAIAQTLYHEIGHHFQRFSHGYAKTRQEDHAENYGHRHARRAFPGWYRLIDAWWRIADWGNRMAIRFLTAAVRLVPAPGLYEKLACRCQRAGLWPRAVAAWERALELDPAWPPAREALPAARAHLHRELRRQFAATAYRPATQSPRRRKISRRNGRRR